MTNHSAIKDFANLPDLQEPATIGRGGRGIRVRDINRCHLPVSFPWFEMRDV